MLSNRNIPYDAYEENLMDIYGNNMFIYFNNYQKDFMMLKDKKLINQNSVNIYFPIYKNFYVQTYESSVGFTIKDIIELIVKTGENAFEFDYKTHNSEHYKYYTGNTEEERIQKIRDIVYIYAIGELYIKNNDIYISVHS